MADRPTYINRERKGSPHDMKNASVVAGIMCNSSEKEV